MTKPTQVCPACGETATYQKWKEKGRACDHCGRISVDGKVTEWCQAKDFEDMLKKIELQQKEQQ